MIPTTPGGCTLAALLALAALIAIPVAGAVYVLPGFESGPVASNPPASLQDAEALWNASGIGSYRITARIGGAWRLNTYTVTVRNGAIADAEVRCEPGMTSLSDCPDDVTAAAEDFTVPGLFARAHDYVDSKDAAWFSADFDPTYGYPISMGFNHPDILDEEWFITVLSFEVLPE